MPPRTPTNPEGLDLGGATDQYVMFGGEMIACVLVRERSSSTLMIVNQTVYNANPSLYDFLAGPAKGSDALRVMAAAAGYAPPAGQGPTAPTGQGGKPVGFP